MPHLSSYVFPGILSCTDVLWMVVVVVASVHGTEAAADCGTPSFFMCV